MESSADKTRLVDPCSFFHQAWSPLSTIFSLKREPGSLREPKSATGRMQWEYSWPSLGPLAAVALIVPVPSMNCEWDSSTMKRISDFQPSKRAQCVYLMSIFSCTTLQSACYASLFLFQVKNDLRRKVKREHTAACLRITVTGPVPTHTGIRHVCLFVFVVVVNQSKENETC